MNNRQISVWCRVALLMLSGSSLPVLTQAHHSFAMFDKTRTVTLKGTVSKVEWSNPHVFLFVAVPDGEAHKVYAVECGSINMLSHGGWKMNTVKPGDKVTVVIYPLRDGRPGGLIDSVTTPAGAVVKG